ncbi:unnamed protein product [Diabrotica balteata]|uniref:Uncharacterized protein n=1 Tax=Diabrotica balteata TaxID=107213 RepID=A0A9N9TE79_DIABA|nr:unnamed protein product [Diabrotica balteata]
MNALVVSHNMFADTPFIKDSRKIPEQIDEEDTISFYLNCILSLLPNEALKSKPLSVMLKLIQEKKAGTIGFLTVDGETIQNETSPDVWDSKKASKIVILGIYAVLAASKSGVRDYNATEISHYSAWLKTRYEPLMIKLGAASDIDIQQYAFDLNTVSLFWKKRLSLRAAILFPFISKDTPNSKNILFNSIRAYGQMVLSWTGMTTVKLANSFADSTDSHAHTLKTVRDDITRLQTAFSRKQERCKDLHYEIPFQWLMEGQDPNLEISKFPELAYCTLYYLKINVKGPWENFRGKIETRESRRLLEEKTRKTALLHI